MGGNLLTLLQPGEILIILGSGIGSFVIANSKDTLRAVMRSLKCLFKRSLYANKSYEELLLFLFSTFKKVRSQGILSIEKFLDEPIQSEILKKYPSVAQNNKDVVFFYDYMRMVSMGFEDYQQLEELMEEEIESHSEEMADVKMAISNLGDAVPALGIVAAVLGVINSMANINAPPEVLGHSIGGALVGTFFGVLLAYAFINPIARCVEKYHESSLEYIRCIKVAILSYAKGNVPIITAEFIRKVIPDSYRPSFIKAEHLLKDVKL